MTSGFDDLRRELDLWGAEGRVAAFWWRDDDAVQPTPALKRLLDLSDFEDVEIGVAVVPAPAEDFLTETIIPRRRTTVFQHGYAHKNHAKPGAPAVECGGERPVEQVLDELRLGFRRLADMFGERFPPILAVPWNRITPEVLARLPEVGFSGVSAYGPRAAMVEAGNLVVMNAHVDPMNWRERRFAGEAKALNGFLGELRARRTADTDPAEPIGLLTHHLDHDDALWDFLETLFSVTRAHKAARWLTIEEAFRPMHARLGPTGVTP